MDPDSYLVRLGLDPDEWPDVLEAEFGIRCEGG